MAHPEKEELRRIMNKIGLDNSLICLANICAEKAEEIRTNPDLAEMAKRWEKMTLFLDNATARLYKYMNKRGKK